MAGDLRGQMRPTAWLTVLGMLGVLAAGCDKLQRSTQGKDAQAAGPTTAQSAVTPARLAVPAAQVVATVNGAAVSNTDVSLRTQELKTLVETANQPWTPLTREQLEQVAEELINTELMAQDAVGRGLDRSLEVQQRWEYLRRQFFAQEWLSWQQTQLEVSAPEVQAYYEQNQLGFREPERVHLRQLVVAAEDQAKQALAQLHSGTVRFEELAQQISSAPTAAQGGRLEPWVMRANEKEFLYGSEPEAQAAGVISLDPVLEAAAFAIDRVGSYSSYVKGPDDRFHIFQLVERQEAAQRALTDVWDDIKTFLQTQKLQQALDALKARATVQRSLERLSEGSP